MIYMFFTPTCQCFYFTKKVFVHNLFVFLIIILLTFPFSTTFALALALWTFCFSFLVCSCFPFCCFFIFFLFYLKKTPKQTKKISIYFSIRNVTVDHVLSLQNEMSLLGFDPGTSHIVIHRSTNWAKGDLH
jgi:hypothetical protein